MYFEDDLHVNTSIDKYKCWQNMESRKINFSDQYGSLLGSLGFRHLQLSNRRFSRQLYRTVATTVEQTVFRTVVTTSKQRVLVTAITTFEQKVLTALVTIVEQTVFAAVVTTVKQTVFATAVTTVKKTVFATKKGKADQFGQ